jgi:hypothetical protein
MEGSRMSAKVMRPEYPYDVDFAVEYRVLKWIDGRDVWCLVAQTNRLDKALDLYGDGAGRRIERCSWEPAPEMPGQTRILPPGATS